jgi:NDP-sugar pyrophosphorylase family protein
MDAVILAGGLGTRARAYLGDTPKFLAPVAGVPLGVRLLTYLAAEQVTLAIIALHHGGTAIAARIGAMCWPENLHLHLDLDPVARGTAGALRRALKTGRWTGSPLLVCNGDTLFRADLSQISWLLKNHNPTYITITAKGVPVVRLLSPAALRIVINAGDEPSLERLLPPEGGLTYPIAPEDYVDIGTREGFDRAQGWTA